MISVKVKHNNIEKALRILKRKTKDSGLFVELKEREYYRKPSEVKKHKESLGKIRGWLKQKELNPDWCGTPPTRGLREKYKKEQDFLHRK